jgi:crotonobetainyl-CoA:carnitine CoA-transferase CaiB-like acyl-CoA transferase
VPAAKVLDVSEFLVDRQVGARDFWAPVELGGQTGRLPSKPFHIPTADPPFRPAPTLGHDTEAILSELGYDTAEIEALVASGAVGAETVGVRS